MSDGVKEALSSEKPKLHAHRVEYERSENGGFHARVHMHHKKAPHEPHHVQHHIVPTQEALQAHMQQQMGDQPDVQVPSGAEPDGDEAAAAGGAAGAGQAQPTQQGM